MEGGPARRGEGSRGAEFRDHGRRRRFHTPRSRCSPALLSAPPAAHPTPLLTRDSPLALFVAPAFFGISALADSRAEAGAPRPTPRGLSPQRSQNILSREAAGRLTSAGNTLCACARPGRELPWTLCLDSSRERLLPAGGSKTPRPNRARAGPSAGGKVVLPLVLFPHGKRGQKVHGVRCLLARPANRQVRIPLSRVHVLMEHQPMGISQ